MEKFWLTSKTSVEGMLFFFLSVRNQNVGQGWLPPKKDTKDTKSLCLNLLPIVKSPVLNNYRNKVEFFIGTGSDGVGNTVGLRHGSNTKGNVSIIGPWKCPNYTLESIEIAHEFQKFIRELPYPSYNNSTHTGANIVNHIRLLLLSGSWGANIVKTT